MTDDKASIQRTAARLRKARHTKGFTQAAVAMKAGISETYYAQIERGEKNPTTSVFISVIKALGVSSADILDK